jgi:hypothetical protein
MRILLLAASDGDADAWIDRFLNMSPNLRTTKLDPYEVRITTVTPADDLAVRLDPGSVLWDKALPIKIMRTDGAKFATDSMVISALARLAARWPVVDPTGLLGPVNIERNHGWAPDGRTAPMGVMTQTNHDRSFVPRTRKPRPALRPLKTL